MTQTANTEKYCIKINVHGQIREAPTNMNLRIQGVNAAILKANCKVVVKPIWIAVRTLLVAEASESDDEWR